MVVVQPQDKFVNKLLGEQNVDNSIEYRRITFCILSEIDGDFVAYNTLTCEIVSLTADEYALLKSDSIVMSPIAETLVKKWFLVPKEHNDVKLVDEVRAFVNVLPPQDTASGYTIFSTTDCNARCYYCFELGRAHKAMDEQTAKETADFIIRTANKAQVKINWFGGEPTYNQKAIDIICDVIGKAGIEYTSSMVSNGYLFDDSVVEKAAKLWKLKTVQITLDGTEEVYNSTKAYIYNDCISPFNKVIDNIERLAKANISVIIRLNMSEQNVQDLYKLVDYIDNRFESQKCVSVYPATLYEDEDEYNKIGALTRRLDILNEYFLLEKYCEDKGLLHSGNVNSKFMKCGCMAQNDNSYMILPDGHLGLCEHYTDSEFIGTIKDGIKDSQKVLSYKEIVFKEDLCCDCRIYPLCMKSKKCPTRFYGCDIAGRMRGEHGFEQRLKYTYRQLKESK